MSLPNIIRQSDLGSFGELIGELIGDVSSHMFSYRLLGPLKSSSASVGSALPAAAASLAARESTPCPQMINIQSADRVRISLPGTTGRTKEFVANFPARWAPFKRVHSSRYFQSQMNHGIEVYN